MFAIKTASTLINLIAGIQDAPEIFSELCEVLRNFKLVLDLLVEMGRRSSGTDGEPFSLGKTTRPIFEDCKRVLNQLWRDLYPLQEQLQRSRIQTAPAFVNLVVNDTSVRDKTNRLESSKLNLIIAMAIDQK